jgi:uncharacterized membrane protein YfcA
MKVLENTYLGSLIVLVVGVFGVFLIYLGVMLWPWTLLGIPIVIAGYYVGKHIE